MQDVNKEEELLEVEMDVEQEIDKDQEMAKMHMAKEQGNE